MKKIIGILFLVLLSMQAVAAQLTIETSNNQKLTLKTEIADTQEKRARGLMFREAIESDYGMIFLFPNKEVVYMWMKNTLIPLDMLFFDENGYIVHIKENAIPHDLTLISSTEPAIGVVEVQGGFSAKHNLKLGDKIHLYRDEKK